MLKTSKDLMEWLGLKVGDRIRCTFEEDEYFTVQSLYEGHYNLYKDEGYIEPISYLINTDFEILPRPKRVGDLKCLENECAKCPLRTIRCDKNDDIGNSLYYILENVLVGNDFDQEIHDLLKARLDKEVEE